MSVRESVAAVIGALNDLSIPYMVVGSFSTNYYGIPRSTQDADFVVQLASGDFARLCARLGTDFKPDPQMSFETITGTTRYRMLGPGSFAFEFFLPSDDAHDRIRFERRRKVVLQGCETWIPTAEDAIVTKLRWSQRGQRGKDLEDVRNMIAVQAERIDYSHVEYWCKEHGTLDLLQQVRASVSPDLTESA